jgi:hypothetical protein
VGFVVDKAALGQVFSDYFDFPCQSFHQFLHIIITRGWHNRPTGGSGAEWTQMDFTHQYTKLNLLAHESEGNIVCMLNVLKTTFPLK